MTKLEKKLRAALRHLGADAGAAVVAAVSGGADSTALLDALVRLRQRDGAPGRILAAHLNHQLRGAEADEDEDFVRALTARLNIPVFIERADVAAQAQAAKQNLEATARRLRYEFLQRVAEQHNAPFACTAHTQDDQAETVLMRLLRGSGAEGLRGIAPVRPLGDRVQLARPLLKVARAEVLAHCAQYGLAFRTDSSNLSLDRTRNRVRHELLPLLRSFNPRADAALGRAARLLAEDEEYLQQAAAALLTRSGCGETINIAPLLNAHPAVRNRALRLWLRERLGSLRRIETAHIAILEKLLTQSQSGRLIQLPGGWQIVREFNTLKLTFPVIYECNPFAPLRLMEGVPEIFGDYELTLLRRLARPRAAALIDALNANSAHALLRECAELDELWVRSRTEGDAYLPAGRHHNIKLKTLMIRHKIPLSARHDHPLLVTGERIVWSPHLPVARELALPDDDAAAVCALVIAQRIVGS